ncbi:glycosyltransferase [Brevibacterium aurantiacum]|nr:glycosyltransferase [Brevibacterium aurantiacum]
MDERTEIRNLWSEIRGWNDDELQALKGNAVTGPVEAPVGVRTELSPLYVLYRDSESRSIIRQEHYRPDGSLLLIDIKSNGSRRLILYQTDGEPLVEWDRARDLYLQWTDHVIVRRPAIFIVDAGPVSVFAHELRPRDFVMIHYLHVSQLKRPERGRNGEIVSNRLESFRNFDSYDFTAVQSRQQIDDLAHRGFSGEKMRLLPSEISESAFQYPEGGYRDELRGCIVARLVELKQIDHAIRAVAEARQEFPGLKLDIYGKGNDLGRLKELVAELGADDAVMFNGHVDDLPKRLAESSFSLLTSKHEGLPLAVRESMAAGCVPITYDITYGPRDIITHGVNGYVVPQGDVKALTDHIVEFLGAEPSNRQLMRESAVTRAKDFLSESIYPEWKKAIEQSTSIVDPEPFRDERYIRSREVSLEAVDAGFVLSIAFADEESVSAEHLQLVLASRRSNTFFLRINRPEVKRGRGKSAQYRFYVECELFDESKKQTFDVFVRKPGAAWESKVRVKVQEQFEALEAGGMKWYRTEYGNFSVSVSGR